MFLTLTKALARIDKLEYASAFLSVVYLDVIEEQLVETQDMAVVEESSGSQTPAREIETTSDKGLAKELAYAAQGLDADEVDDIDEQIVESMITVESPDQDEEPEPEMSETQKAVEELVYTTGEPTDCEDLDEAEEKTVESMIVVEGLDQDEEQTTAEEHVTIEHSIEVQAQAATNDSEAAEPVDTAVDEPMVVTLLDLQQFCAKVVAARQERESLENLALAEEPSNVESLVLVEEPVFAEKAAIEDGPESASDSATGSPSFRTRSASCGSSLEACVVSLPLPLPLRRRLSCSGRLPGYARPFTVPSLPSSPDLVQSASPEQIEEPSFPRVERLPTDTEVATKLDTLISGLEQEVNVRQHSMGEVRAKIHQWFAGPCATQTSSIPPPPPAAPLVSTPAPVAQAVEAISPPPIPRAIKVFTARRALRHGRSR